MKSKFTKISAFILSIIILAIALFSCAAPNVSNQPSQTVTQTQSDTDNTEETPSNSESASDSENSDTENIDNNKDSDGTLTVYANNAYNVKIISSANVKDYNKSIKNSIRNLFGKLSGAYAELQTDEKILDAPAILVGETNYSESKEVYKTLQKNQAKATVVGNKYVIAYSSEAAAIKLFEKLKELFNEHATAEKIVINSNWDISLTAIDKTSASSQNKVLACDQKNKRIVIYDFNKYTQTTSLDSMEARVLNVGHTTDVKYREGTVFGDVLLIMGDAASANSGIYDYASGKSLWTTSNPGSNPHSIEILPSGNIVMASTSDNKIRLFKTSALLNNDKTTANKYTDYTLEDAHGVLWDPTYKVLWALGRYELKAYYIKGSGTNEALVEATQMSIALPEGHRGGHDLSPDYTNTRYLYITVGEFALKIDKKEHRIIADYEYYKLMNAKNIKGFSNNPAGNFFITGEIGTTSFASWCTDSIYFCRYNGTTYEKIKLTSSKSAFYKARALCGTYQ